MLKLAALGALGYAGYKYFRNNRDEAGRLNAGRSSAVAGGPLSDRARLQHTADAPPA